MFRNFSEFVLVHLDQIYQKLIRAKTLLRFTENGSNFIYNLVYANHSNSTQKNMTNSVIQGVTADGKHEINFTCNMLSTASSYY